MAKRLESLTLLAGVVLASLSAISIGGRPRPLLAFAAIALLAVVGLLRLRAAMRSGGKRPASGAYQRAQRIHEERNKRFWR